MGPGAIVYMPPEALEDNNPDDEEEEDEEVSQVTYGRSIDIFSFGVVAIFTLCQTFPNKLLAPNYREDGEHKARTELERRDRYMRVIYGQLGEIHPLVQMIVQCLGFPEDRPSIHEVLRWLEEGREEVRDEQTDMNKLELLQALQTQQGNQVIECVCVCLWSVKHFSAQNLADRDRPSRILLQQQLHSRNDSLRQSLDLSKVLIIT